MSNLNTVFNAAVKAISATIVGLLNRIMGLFVGFLRKLPGGDALLERMGFDPETAGAAFRENVEAAMQQYKSAKGELLEAGKNVLNDRADAGAAGIFNRVREAGKQAREEAAASLSDEIAQGKHQGFDG